MKRVCWDSCTWLGILNEEAEKWPGCEYILSQARKGKVEILISTFVHAEVYKTRCDEPYKMLAEEFDMQLEEYFNKEYIIIAAVDEEVAIRARALLRYYSDKGLKKPQDAIHLATASLYDADELHTFDNDDLLKLNGLIKNEKGEYILIRKPPEPPSEESYKTSLLQVEKTIKDELLDTLSDSPENEDELVVDTTSKKLVNNLEDKDKKESDNEGAAAESSGSSSE